MGLTRLVAAFYDELAMSLKLRLITPDRPGIGESQRYQDGYGAPLTWPGTYTYLLEQLHSIGVYATELDQCLLK